MPTKEPTPLKDADGNSTGGVEFNGQELLELSCVPVPANSNALARAVTKGVISEGDVEKFFSFGEKNPPWAYMVPGVTYAGTGQFRVAINARQVDVTIKRAQTGAPRVQHGAGDTMVLELPTGLGEADFADIDLMVGRRAAQISVCSPAGRYS